MHETLTRAERRRLRNWYRGLARDYRKAARQSPQRRTQLLNAAAACTRAAARYGNSLKGRQRAA